MSASLNEQAKVLAKWVAYVQACANGPDPFDRGARWALAALARGVASSNDDKDRVAFFEACGLDKNGNARAK